MGKHLEPLTVSRWIFDRRDGIEHLKFVFVFRGLFFAKITGNCLIFIEFIEVEQMAHLYTQPLHAHDPHFQPPKMAESVCEASSGSFDGVIDRGNYRGAVQVAKETNSAPVEMLHAGCREAKTIFAFRQHPESWDGAANLRNA